MNPEPIAIAIIVPPADADGAQATHDLAVRKLDGTTEILKVRPVLLPKIGEYMDRVGDLISFVELIASKPAGWADTLTDDSIYAIDTLGRELNNARLSRMLDRQVAAVGNLKPLATKIADLQTAIIQRS